jgi:hypothetical protein
VVQAIKKVLNNIGKYSKISLSASEEFQFYKEIISIVENRYNCKVSIISESDSQEKKAAQSLPGKPAIVIK